ncbi:serine hydrolase [Actinomyces naeslundii]|uniref:Serine hydrolase n=1 Tax=Actinomyces naeslundii TaxID=1655 RepID=A0ABX3F292_ACTNA|nr:alpha/beta fold hydrolase [Actinomyces naeslundii]OLO82587.1 serine hydrolase [Actinomyces naeslundii]OLO88199.1 serine hydrolase [Actinomyces naeslundii]
MDHVTEHCSSDRLGRIDRVILVHGFGAGPHDHWFPWLARSIRHVEVPRLPHPESPDASTWASTIAERIGTSPDGMAGLAIVTHSLGGLTALRAIERVIARGSPANGDGRHLAAFIAVAPFAQQLPPTGEAELDHFLTTGLKGFLDGASPGELRPLLGPATVIHSDNDPLVPRAASRRFATAISADVVTVPGAGHFLASDGVTSLPQVVQALGRASDRGAGAPGK